MTRTSAILSVRAALRRVLVADAPLVALLGGPQVFDDAPRGLVPPYVVFGDAVAQDWSSGDRTGARQSLSLVVWSQQGGDAEALAIAARLAEVVTTASIVPDGQVLVGLRVLAEETARPRPDAPEAGMRRAIVRLEVLTQAG